MHQHRFLLVIPERDQKLIALRSESFERLVSPFIEPRRLKTGTGVKLARFSSLEQLGTFTLFDSWLSSHCVIISPWLTCDGLPRTLVMFRLFR